MAEAGAAPDFSMKRNDRKPSIRATLKTKNTDGTESVVDLTGATVKFLMSAPGAASAKISAAAVVESPATSGIVRYDWVAPNTSKARADWRAEFEVTFADSTKETFPSRGFLTIEITEDLG